MHFRALSYTSLQHMHDEEASPERRPLPQVSRPSDTVNLTLLHYGTFLRVSDTLTPGSRVSVGNRIPFEALHLQQPIPSTPPEPHSTVFLPRDAVGSSVPREGKTGITTKYPQF